MIKNHLLWMGIGREIDKQNHAQNDPIKIRIKDFLSTFQKIKIHNSSGEFFFLPGQKLDFKHSLDADLSLAEEENKIFERKDCIFQRV